MNYTNILAALANLMGTDTADSDLLIILPSAFLYAEGRIFKELDLLAGNIRDSTASTVASTRAFTLPTTYGTFLIVDGINIITPAETAPESGVRKPLQPVSRDFLDWVWPSTTGADVPDYFAYLSQDTYTSPAPTQIIFGPWPDAAYRVEVIGKMQPATLSSGNTNTWLSDNLPELFLAACMVFLTGWKKNFGAQADDPRQAMSWEQQYKTLVESAGTYEARKRFAGASWSPKPVEPVAVPQRG